MPNDKSNIAKSMPLNLWPISAVFLGGYNDKNKAKGNITFYEDRVEFSALLSTKFTIPTSEIIEVAIEGTDEVTRRVTATRFLLTGFFAFAIKKKGKDKQSYITLVLKDGQEAIFFVEKKAPAELKAKMSKIIVQAKLATTETQNQSTQQVSVGSVADEIEKLLTLKEKGVLTQDEFDAQKARLLS